jgi:hypothetical protein
MKNRLALLAALLLLAACSHKPVPPWMLSDEKPRDENYHGGNASILLMRYDADQDGVLTKQELAAGLRAEFAAHDTHHNGCLDADQVAEINQARVEADQATATPIMDWNQDGCVDYTEFSAAPYSLFDQMDANHDGKLTAKELGPAAVKRAAAQCTQQPAQEGRRGRGRRGDAAAPPQQCVAPPDSDAAPDGGEPPPNPPPAQ